MLENSPMPKLFSNIATAKLEWVCIQCQKMHLQASASGANILLKSNFQSYKLVQGLKHSLNMLNILQRSLAII